MPLLQYFGWVGRNRKAGLLGSAPEYRGRRRRSLPPIRFTGCEEKADTFAPEIGPLLSKVFRVLPHQSSHQHWEQNEVHENLRGAEASLGAERPLWTALKGVGRIVQDMRNRSCGPISACLMDMAAQRRESVCFGNRGARYADRVLKKSFHELGADTCELVRHCASPGLVAIEVRQSGDDTDDDRFEECLLAVEVSINRRLARRRHLRDLIYTGALVTSLEKNLLGRVENTAFDVASVLGRPAQAGLRSLRFSVCGHDCSCDHDAAISSILI